MPCGRCRRPFVDEACEACNLQVAVDRFVRCCETPRRCCGEVGHAREFFVAPCDLDAKTESARWREAVNLTRSQVTKYRITFVRTKGKKNRSIPISKELYEEIMALDGFNFFTDCYFQFLSVMEKTSIVLPRGQLTHVLRHTFAAHFMMSGGNILALQKILGHHDIKMTMRYAHLAPDHLETALRFNPLATLPSGDKVAAAVGITP